MRSLELPTGSVLITIHTQPDGIYLVKNGLAGLFDRFERLLSVVYKGDIIGFESVYSAIVMYTVKSLTFVELEHYDVDEFKKSLDDEKRLDILKNYARYKWNIKKRYDMDTEERMRDIIRELKDMEVEETYYDQMIVGLTINDALIFEKVRGEEG